MTERILFHADVSEFHLHLFQLIYMSHEKEVLCTLPQIVTNYFFHGVIKHLLSGTLKSLLMMLFDWLNKYCMVKNYFAQADQRTVVQKYAHAQTEQMKCKPVKGHLLRYKPNYEFMLIMVQLFLGKIYLKELCCHYCNFLLS